MLLGGGPFAPKPAGKIDQPICINTTLVLAHFSKKIKEESSTFVVHWVQLHIEPPTPHQHHPPLRLLRLKLLRLRLLRLSLLGLRLLMPRLSISRFRPIFLDFDPYAFF
jgi:hypothetical protein